jgi:hypothetical protein
LVASGRSWWSSRTQLADRRLGSAALLTQK